MWHKTILLFFLFSIFVWKIDGKGFEALKENKRALLAKKFGKKYDAELVPNAKKEDFQILHALGRGSFGVVEKVKHKKTGKEYAMKTIDLEENTWDAFELEIKANHGAYSSFIVRMEYYFWDEPEQEEITKEKPRSFQLLWNYFTPPPETIPNHQNHPKTGYIVLQLLSGGDFQDFLRQHKRLQEDQARFYVACMVMAVQYLQTRDMVHRDLKPGNFLFGDNGYLLLADFGLSRSMKKSCKSRTFCGTALFMAPEIIKANEDPSIGYTQAVDWWSVGAILLEMLTGLPPFDGPTAKEVFKNILFGEIVIPKELSKNAKDFVVKLLEREPTKRLGYKNASEVKKHPFFDGFDWQLLNNQKMPAPYILNKQTGKYKKNIMYKKAVVPLKNKLGNDEEK